MKPHLLLYSSLIPVTHPLALIQTLTILFLDDHSEIVSIQILTILFLDHSIRLVFLLLISCSKISFLFSSTRQEGDWHTVIVARIYKKKGIQVSFDYIKASSYVSNGRLKCFYRTNREDDIFNWTMNRRE